MQQWFQLSIYGYSRSIKTILACQLTNFVIWIDRQGHQLWGQGETWILEWGDLRVSGQSQASAIETGVYQTLEVGSYLTQIAEGGAAINTVTPSIAEEIVPTQANTATVECSIAAGQPSFDQLNFPEELGGISEQNDTLLLNDTEVVASFQSDADCNQVIWLSLANSPEWPIFIKGSNGEWALGASAWNGKLEVVNATEFPVSFSLEPLEADQSISSGTQ